MTSATRSRLLASLEAAIKAAANPIAAQCLRAERAALLARQGHLERALGAVECAGQAQKARVVVQRQDQPVKLEQHLHGIGVGHQMAFVDGQADRTLERAVPGHHHRGQRVAHRAGPS